MQQHTPVVFESVFAQPFRTARPGDVGHDLYTEIVCQDQNFIDRIVSFFLGTFCIVIWPFSARGVRSGIALSMAEDVWCLITARSSTARRRLQVLGGVIDSGYRGELFTVFHNFGLLPRIICSGERYSQVIFFPAVRPGLYQTAAITRDDTDRGAAGFGSTGK